MVISAFSSTLHTPFHLAPYSTGAWNVDFPLSYVVSALENFGHGKYFEKL